MAPKANEDDKSLAEQGEQQQRKKAADDSADIEAMTVAEYSRWLIAERNWKSAEEVRQSYMTGAQLRKTREDKHRERGQLRQQDQVEQVKEAKAKVEAHRESNLAKGSQVKRDVMAWTVEKHENREAYLAANKASRDAVVARSNEDEKARKKMFSDKEAKAKAVMEEVKALASEHEKIKELTLEENKAKASKVRRPSPHAAPCPLLTTIRSARGQPDAQTELRRVARSLLSQVREETNDQVTDEARKVFFTQRRDAAKATQESVTKWEAERKRNRQEFQQKVHGLMEKSKGMRDGGKESRRELAAIKKKAAMELRSKKGELAEQRQAGLQERLKASKQIVNKTVAGRFTDTHRTREMVQHQHYSELSAVAVDPTSPVSREIASSPNRRSYRGESSPTGGAQSPMPSKAN